jgi:hypothetical protein
MAELLGCVPVTFCCDGCNVEGAEEIIAGVAVVDDCEEPTRLVSPTFMLGWLAITVLVIPCPIPPVWPGILIPEDIGPNLGGKT